MEKEIFIENRFDKLEEELKEINRKIKNNSFNGALFTSLLAIPSILLLGSELPFVFGLVSAAVLVPTAFIGNGIRENNKKKFINKREDYIDELDNSDNTYTDTEKLQEKISKKRRENHMDKASLDGIRFFKTYFEFITIMFALLSTIFSSNLNLSIVTMLSLITSISSEIAYTLADKKVLDNNLEIDNNTDLIEASNIDLINTDRENRKGLSNNKVYDVVSDKDNNKTINELSVNEYLDQLVFGREDEVSKKFIKTK